VITPEGAGIAMSLASTVVTDEVILTDWFAVQPEEYPRSALARMSGAVTSPFVTETLPVPTETSPTDVVISPLPVEILPDPVDILPDDTVIFPDVTEMLPLEVILPVAETVFAVRLFMDRSTVPVTLVELVIVLGPAGPAGPAAPDNTVS